MERGQAERSGVGGSGRSELVITSRELGVPKAGGDGEVQQGRGVRQFRYYSVGEVLYLWTLEWRGGD